jgi:hypothetical protein
MADRSRFTVIQGGNQPAGPSRDESDAIARDVISQMTKGGKATFPSWEAADSHLRQRLGFRRIEKSRTPDLLPDGWQFIYQRGRILTRVKTKGTKRRPRPHMVVSLTLGGTAWNQEQAKYNSAGVASPAILLKDPMANPPALQRLNLDLTPERQDAWANNTHFDFPDGFDDSGADEARPE